MCRKRPGREKDPGRFLHISPPQMGLILIPLERSWFLVYKKVWNLKIQQSNQKLWLQEVSGVSIGALTGFRDISTVLTLISTHE